MLMHIAIEDPEMKFVDFNQILGVFKNRHITSVKLLFLNNLLASKQSERDTIRGVPI